MRTFNGTALSRVPQSPVLAWAWATYLLSAPVRDRLDCLTAALERWADAARLARVLVDEELFLSTLIVCMLASIAAGSQELEDALVAVAHSRAVLDGVSAHLAHADPLVRRTGMLVGELLSERTARPAVRRSASARPSGTAPVGAARKRVCCAHSTMPGRTIRTPSQHAPPRSNTTASP